MTITSFSLSYLEQGGGLKLALSLLETDDRNSSLELSKLSELFSLNLSLAATQNITLITGCLAGQGREASMALAG